MKKLLLLAAALALTLMVGAQILAPEVEFVSDDVTIESPIAQPGAPAIVNHPEIASAATRRDTASTMVASAVTFVYIASNESAASPKLNFRNPSIPEVMLTPPVEDRGRPRLGAPSA